MLHTKDRSFLKSCRFSPENHYCPIFRLGTLVSYTGNNFQEMALEVILLKQPAFPEYGLVTALGPLLLPEWAELPEAGA